MPGIATAATFNARRGASTLKDGRIANMGKASGSIARAEQRVRDAKLRVVAAQEIFDAFKAEGWPVEPGVRRELAEAQEELRAATLAEMYGHKPGTPETYAKLAAIPMSQKQSPIGRMYESGALTSEQYNASEEIVSIAEMIERAVSVRGASLEARVDNSGAARDVLIESLGRVRLEMVYTSWRARLPMPRRLVLDMVLTNRPLVATAKVYGIPWRKARDHLIKALDRWSDIKDMVWRSVDAEDIETVYRRLGCGALTLPRARPEQELPEETGEE